jgi:hypothetical protein
VHVPEYCVIFCYGLLYYDKTSWGWAVPSSGTCCLAGWVYFTVEFKIWTIEVIFYGCCLLSFKNFQNSLHSPRVDLQLLDSFADLELFWAIWVIFLWVRLPRRSSSIFSKYPIKNWVWTLLDWSYNCSNASFPDFRIVWAIWVIFYCDCLPLRTSSIEVVFYLFKIFQIVFCSTTVDLQLLESKFYWFISLLFRVAGRAGAGGNKIKANSAQLN